ncbi:MAG TPA: succinyldiaminopimelate transaminase [Actinomycetales bacterium]|nr:succinyldiaminopimelate transaminase [Actinomycetales bacterium]
MQISGLPDFPWDSLGPITAHAKTHSNGFIDLSVGTPVDPTPERAQSALRDAANAPGYPSTAGTVALHEAVLDWFTRARGVDAMRAGLSEDGVLPTIGLKEFVAFLPGYLGLGANDTVMYPRIAYPTYDIGARLVGAQTIAADATTAVGPGEVQLVWLNSPSNPTGKVLGIEHLAKVVAWARERGAIVVADECYAELPWEEPWRSAGVPSILDPRVTGGSPEGVLALYSLSKRSNLAGYRAGFAAGDPKIIAPILEVRKHAGMMMPGPVQATMETMLRDDAHVVEQRERYRKRRALLRSALEAAGFRIDDSEAGLYLWVTHDEILNAHVSGAPASEVLQVANGGPRAGGEPQAGAWTLLEWFADRGILVAPGTFYGPAGKNHVRIALTANDVDVAAAARRIAPHERGA